MTSQEEDLPQPSQEYEENDSYSSYNADCNENISTSGTYGYITTPRNKNVPKQKDATATEALRQAYQANNRSTSIDFPFVAQKAVNEYDKTSKLFCKAFPWLFPGGRGDFHDYSEVKETIDQWMKRLLYFEDGRFASDKMWAFFGLNYAVRKKF